MTKQYNHHAPIISHTRNNLYKSARILGDINAVNRTVSGDPSAIGKRIIRRVIGRSIAKTLWRRI